MGIPMVQGGSGFPFFAPSTLKYISGVDLCSILVGRDEIDSGEVEETIEKVHI